MSINRFANTQHIMNQDSIFEQATQITKAHAFDIISEQNKQLITENSVLRNRVKYLEDLIKEYTGKMLSKGFENVYKKDL